jgi:coenzyme F420-reducing hydrogenase delta subunit
MELLQDFGYESDRFSISWVSSAEPDKFVKIVTEMTERVRQLGPNLQQQTEDRQA